MKRRFSLLGLWQLTTLRRGDGARDTDVWIEPNTLDAKGPAKAQAPVAPAGEIRTTLEATTGFRVRSEAPQKSRFLWARTTRDRTILAWPGGCAELTRESLADSAGGIARELQPLKISMPGKVVSVRVKPGDLVEKGQCLLIVEAMKMENNILALGRAKVAKVLVKQEDRLESGALLVEFTAP